MRKAFSLPSSTSVMLLDNAVALSCRPGEDPGQKPEAELLSP